MSDRPLCKCGKPVRYKGMRAGRRRYGNTCSSCHKKRYDLRPEKKGPYWQARISPGWALYGRPSKRLDPQQKRRAKHLKQSCDRCGFVPEHSVQLQLDHVDGNRANNDPSNLQTLCANCHALKTHMNGDYKTPSTWPADHPAADAQMFLFIND